MRTTNYDAIAASVPLDGLASSVRDGSGDMWEVKPGDRQRWKAPPIPTHPLNEGSRDWTGVVQGRLTVIRFHGYTTGKWGRALWLVRCLCGDYEARRGDALKRYRPGISEREPMCFECEAVEALRTRTAKPSTKKSREREERVLEQIAASGKPA